MLEVFAVCHCQQVLLLSASFQTRNFKREESTLAGGCKRGVNYAAICWLSSTMFCFHAELWEWVSSWRILGRQPRLCSRMQTTSKHLCQCCVVKELVVFRCLVVSRKISNEAISSGSVNIVFAGCRLCVISVMSIRRRVQKHTVGKRGRKSVCLCVCGLMPPLPYHAETHTGTCLSCVCLCYSGRMCEVMCSVPETSAASSVLTAILRWFCCRRYCLSGRRCRFACCNCPNSDLLSIWRPTAGGRGIFL